ncbi:hypothetical protein DCO58_07485 [Helicobacter saguini]|uniref:Uncharacterized protein n=1 Tax=Helicobacter saguini TaxID=1548018 RepID=A0A347W4J3_9HELI|nr:hypothetical protein [Helicobacter saguini]MWV61824.1 hypothetical protein [Helicobacter saguini]MWV67501.1 hypothetical protein [Helicobacter saguini]MWV69852.1 hypothetical protein [Helicobacter saguini]MWV72930.1 hypothetical protein [Helicobacter saguini]TLD95686.1 hypothetical protein LS64_002205 [Helicobacter saguini]
MKGAIFEEEEISLWKKLYDEVDRINETPPYNSMTEEEMRMEVFKFMLQTIKSYKQSPNGNGMKWSKEEKEKFIKLSYKEQRKMIVRKSELKSSLFPYVDVDYEPYKYSDRISDTAKKAYDKATKILESKSKIDFNNLDSKIQQEILQNLRIAYNERYLKAGVELARLLFKKSHLKGGDESRKDLYECLKITKELMNEKIPENSYMYYQLYKWSIDNDRLYNSSMTAYDLGLLREVALECYNHALESIVWEAIDEEAQREENNYTRMFRAELYLAAAIKYQSPLAFYLAAHNYSPNDVFPYSVYNELIMHHACLRCSIALGGDGIDTLRRNYISATKNMPISPLKATKLKTYQNKSSTQKGLINGLDPYFDTKFPPDLIIDFSFFCTNCMYGAIKLDDDGRWMGISWAVEHGYVKDPRTKDSTLESIKEYYLMMWKVIVQRYKGVGFEAYTGAIYIIGKRIYSNLIYGLPSARPYIFPKEVLDLKIDFNEGLEEVYKTKK